MKKLTCTLLVDDDDTVNFLNQTLLEDMNVSEQILIAHDGQEALNILKKQCEDGCCPQLVLLDINMPVMNGFEFLEAYENLDITQKQSVLVVMLTTSLNPNDIERVHQGAVMDFLNKPLTEEMVRDLLRKHFNQELPNG